ncbi:MAG: hypothetical protein JO042_01715 [Sinobacteraceae bacterium]|nr:hypothetical protein [Nevskiaceae bacterium]
MSKPQKPVGQVVADENGNRSWVWQSEDGVDTARVRALAEDLSLDKAAPGQAIPTLDPYNQDSLRTKEPKRRTLDDMRRLSEQIKNAKQWKGKD